jgi:hypothetical protein
MALLTLDAIGSEGEKLAMAAGDSAGVAVGFDPEFECATFDADGYDDDELEAAVFEALDDLDADWRTHLRIAE